MMLMIDDQILQVITEFFKSEIGLLFSGPKYRENSFENVAEFNNLSISAVKDAIMKSLNITYFQEVFCQNRLVVNFSVFPSLRDQ